METHLKGIGVENFKIFKGYQTFDFAPLTILTGANNSGKSSFIKILKFIEFFRSKNFKSLFDLFNYNFASEEFVKKFGSLRSLANYDSDDWFKISFDISYAGEGQEKLTYHFDTKKGLIEIEIFDEAIKEQIHHIKKCDNDYNTKINLMRCLGLNEKNTLKKEIGNLSILFICNPFFENIDPRLCFSNKEFADKFYKSFPDLFDNKKKCKIGNKKYNKKLLEFLSSFTFSSKSLYGYEIGIKDSEAAANIPNFLKPNRDGLDADHVYLDPNTIFYGATFEYLSTCIYYKYCHSKFYQFIRSPNTQNNSLESFENFLDKYLIQHSSLLSDSESLKFIRECIFLYIHCIEKQNEIFKPHIDDYIDNITYYYLINPFYYQTVKSDDENTKKEIAKGNFFNRSGHTSKIKQSDSFLLNFNREISKILERELLPFKDESFEKDIDIPVNYYFLNIHRITHQRYYNIEDEMDLMAVIKKYFKVPNQEKIKCYINKWLKEFEIAQNFEIRRLESSNIVEINLRDFQTGQLRPLNDFGFGVSQIFCLLLFTFGAVDIYGDLLKREPQSNYSVCVIEEPETNLHPAMQSKLADMFVEASKELEIHFIVETHSEYLTRNLQIRTMEYYMKKDKNEFTIPTSFSQIYYFYILQEKYLKVNFKFFLLT